MFTRILLMIALGFSSVAVPAQSSRPASFEHEESKRRLENLIEFPKEVSGKVSLVLSCVSRIKQNGRMDETGCYQNNQFEAAFTGSVNKAAKKARLIPAIVNGKPAEIYLQFRVEFVREGEIKKEVEKGQDEEKKKKKKKKGEDEKEYRVQAVHLYLNPGYEENVLEYGFEHIAGQRVIGKKEPWTDVCPARAQYSVWVRAYLSEEGKAESPTIEFGNGIRPISTCLDAIKKTIISSQYTPAMSEGVPVPSTYIEVFSN